MTKRVKELSLSPSELSRARAELAAARGKARFDLVLDHRNPTALVRALPADELYLFILEVGLADAVELVQLASPDQFRTFLDLELWRGGLEPRRALPWLRAARSDSMDGPREAARWKRKRERLDPELIHLLLLDTLRIHDLDQDPDPDLVSDRFMRTPENRYIIEFAVDGAEYAAVRGLVDDLYAEDPFLATRLLSAIRSDLPSELEEAALRWRTARLSDLGYPTLEEALSWFARPAPAGAPPAGVPARPPGFLLERIGRGSLLARAAERMSPEEREHLEGELVSAANAVLVADAVDPGDLEAVTAAVASARALVELGLEETAGTDADRAAEALATTAAKVLFQRGFGRVLRLGWRAERLLASGRAGTRAAPLLDSPLGEMVAALAARRPLYHPGIDEPRAEWGSPALGALEPRPFRSPAEVARTAEALDLAEALAGAAERLGLAREPTAGQSPPRLAVLYLTALANERLGRAFTPVPLDRTELRAAARALGPDDPRLAPLGPAGVLLAQAARAGREELAAALEAGAEMRPEALGALLVKP